jgi:hypothetical protein
MSANRTALWISHALLGFFGVMVAAPIRSDAVPAATAPTPGESNAAAPGRAGLKAAERARAFARLPNWSGQWQIVGATPDAAGGFVESLQETLRVMKQWGPPPYTPAAQAVFDQVAASVHGASGALFKAGVAPEPLSRPMCAFGFPSVMIESPLMFEVLSTPEETALIFSGREIRHVYTDGRAHTPADELFATLWGDSIGHWEGQTLVIDTIAVEGPDGRASTGIMAFGGDANAQFEIVAVFSPAARYTERIRMIDADHLEDRMTVVDPRVLSKPWVITRRYSRVKTLNRMIHEDCEGEERNPIVDGQYTLAPPPPAPPPLPVFELPADDGMPVTSP